ncbi:YciI family protein [Hyphomicrobium sp. CS1GBMeth3]|uniref:YciI family protein n=1 Tax=Hyphomicrobium sp. CS1GBMeth3 TaxID=1892845 RepID=UPI000930C501|nr:YciI family protein [Hyphomicrobium sp. CS1GBMeth3]
MRYVILVKATVDSEAGTMPTEELAGPMADYHEEMAKAGVLVDGNGLRPTSAGYRLKYQGDKRILIDGPFTETKEIIAGYTIIKVTSTEEALGWFKRFPNPHNADCEIELRRLYELEDFGPLESMDRFRELGINGAEKKS